MKRSIFSILVIGLASFALCSCDKAPSSLNGKTIELETPGDVVIPLHFDEDTVAVEIMGVKKKLKYTYSKKSSDTAEIICNMDDEEAILIATFDSSSKGSVGPKGKKEDKAKFTIIK